MVIDNNTCWIVPILRLNATSINCGVVNNTAKKNVVLRIVTKDSDMARHEYHHFDP